MKMADVVVALDAWIIQDGNYGDFARDINDAFALEFLASEPLEQFEPGAAPTASLTRVKDACYEVSGEVVHVADDWWVINVGILAFQDGKPPAYVRQGNWLHGRTRSG
jgi:hypothetical protein